MCMYGEKEGICCFIGYQMNEVMLLQTFCYTIMYAISLNLFSDKGICLSVILVCDVAQRCIYSLRSLTMASRHFQKLNRSYYISGDLFRNVFFNYKHVVE